MLYWQTLLASLIGLALGSFIGAITYRLPRGLKFIYGRSFCDGCGRTLAWYENIPLVSFVVLIGRSTCCKKKISPRYPIIEAVSFLGSGLIFYFTQSPWYIVFFLILFSVFVTDMENMYIFDEQIILLFCLSFLFVLWLFPAEIYQRLFSGFSVSLIFLLLNIITKGKGMGLGDVKLAVSLGILLGIGKIVTWMFLSFLTGGFVAFILLLIGKARLKAKIAFGPFMIVSFLITFFFNVKFF